MSILGNLETMGADVIEALEPARASGSAPKSLSSDDIAKTLPALSAIVAWLAKEGPNHPSRRDDRREAHRPCRDVRRSWRRGCRARDRDRCRGYSGNRSRRAGSASSADTAYGPFDRATLARRAACDLSRR
jgi:hypothetical protein